jgi:toxin YoeB
LSKRGKSSPKEEPSERISIFQRQCREDLAHWVQQDRKIALRIFTLIEDTMRHPFTGLGKPEPLKHLPGNVWSRRITQEDRLVYRVYENKVDFLQARYHY